MSKLSIGLVKDEVTVNALADAIEASSRQLFGGGTSISGAIDYSRLLLAASPFLGFRRVIDISGDGANNRGRAAMLARDEAVRDGISINGLPILCTRTGAGPLLLRQCHWRTGCVHGSCEEL